MAEILKDRSELDPQFQWDLTPMYESDAAWEAALESLDADIESLSAFAGKLSDAVVCRQRHHIFSKSDDTDSGAGRHCRAG